MSEPEYVVIDAGWLRREIRNAEILKEHADGTGKPVAVAAAAVRLATLRELDRFAVPGLAPEAGSIALSIARPPAAGRPSK